MNTPEQLQKMKEGAAKIQPPTVRDRDLLGTLPEESSIYDYMMTVYDELCKRDVPFNITFVMPKSEKPICFFRYCEPMPDNQRFQRIAHIMNNSLWTFLCWSGFVKWLAGCKYIRILKKGQHTTWGEENKI